MTSFVAVPNVSEGRDPRIIAELVEAVIRSGPRVVDVHSDPIHNRTVLTVHGALDECAGAIGSLASTAARLIDLTTHSGVHPTLGALDICPFVEDEGSGDAVAGIARAAARAIWDTAGIPVYLYGAAASRRETRELPDLRRGGLTRLVERSARDLPPDVGSGPIDLKTGVVCAGARGVLIAFNVWLPCDVRVASEIARAVRADPFTTGVRALGLDLGEGMSQVSMNLTRPRDSGIDHAFELVARLASRAGVEVHGTEIVGVPPERYMPDPNAQAARLLLGPGRSLEAALAG